MGEGFAKIVSHTVRHILCSGDAESRRFCSARFPLCSPRAQISLNSITGETNPNNLSSVVEKLISVTSDHTDTDNDTIPDSVETVIGTDFNNTDSDFDGLNDSYEIQLGLNPLNPDSNNDGLPDYYEVTNVPSLDVDRRQCY